MPVHRQLMQGRFSRGLLLLKAKSLREILRPFREAGLSNQSSSMIGPTMQRMMQLPQLQLHFGRKACAERERPRQQRLCDRTIGRTTPRLHGLAHLRCSQQRLRRSARTIGQTMARTRARIPSGGRPVLRWSMRHPWHGRHTSLGTSTRGHVLRPPWRRSDLQWSLKHLQHVPQTIGQITTRIRLRTRRLHLRRRQTHRQHHYRIRGQIRRRFRARCPRKHLRSATKQLLLCEVLIPRPQPPKGSTMLHWVPSFPHTAVLGWTLAPMFAEACCPLRWGRSTRESRLRLPSTFQLGLQA
mmetsp:Transcript_6169/g.15080  ORF Transcript_6169/g.15080 Transcript_6169/m.15080 type:complete len:298 (-) Transcript_6169:310-1203(-)